MGINCFVPTRIVNQTCVACLVEQKYYLSFHTNDEIRDLPTHAYVPHTHTFAAWGRGYHTGESYGRVNQVNWECVWECVDITQL
jgi:hypothetical protein